MTTSIHITPIFTLNLLAILLGCGSDLSTSGDTATTGGSTSEGSTSETPTTSEGSTSEAPTTSGTTSPDGLPAAPAGFMLGLAQVKQFEFTWAEAAGAQYYQLLESADGQAPFVQIGDDVVGLAAALTVPLYARLDARYMLRACNDVGCTDSEAVDVTGTLVEAIGYFKASNTEFNDNFGYTVALSGDGSTLAVGAPTEDSNATGIGGDQADNSESNSGAVYVFTHDDKDIWTQQAYVKASNIGGRFGESLALSEDGSTLAVGASAEDSGATGIDGDPSDLSADQSGAVYMYTRDNMNAWTQQAYVKASNTGAKDHFGTDVALSDDGSTLAVGAATEDSAATGIDGDQADDSALDAGAVYVFARDGMAWTQQAYIKAASSDADDYFGLRLALSGDGSTLAVGAYGEDGDATGIDGDPADDSAKDAGAVYVYARDEMNIWTQQAYVKATNTDAGDRFGASVELSGDGSILAVGADHEDSNAVGIDADQADNSAIDAGAVYVYAREGMNLWTPQAYVKASNSGTNDRFGGAVALSGAGSTLVVGASKEGSFAVGIGGDQADDSGSTGAVYVYERDAMNALTQQAYVKASNSPIEPFGMCLALATDGKTLAVGAFMEYSGATGIGGDQTDMSAYASGAVYVY